MGYDLTNKDAIKKAKKNDKEKILENYKNLISKKPELFDPSKIISNADRDRENLIKKYGEKDGLMIFNDEISEQDYLKKKGLIDKYGEEDGVMIFNGKIKEGMSKEMVEESLGQPSFIYKENYYYGRPFAKVVTFKNEKLESDEELQRSIWLDMPKDVLIASWGKPADEKEDVSKDKIKLKWYFGARKTRQGTTAYKHEVRLENDLVVGWKELE